ncbi:MAG: hypothetical protein DCF12_18670 [Snowella sp.]|jgi:hypothetical protein|nr:MAG: hypothetical protein DCF12_18670 [Snowella sp.]
MTNFNSQDREPTPKVEVEVNPDLNFATDALPLSEKVSQWLQVFKQWYGKLPGAAKIAVAIGVIFFSLSLLTKVLHLVASIISVTILAIILYGLYRFFLKSDASPKS